MIAKLEDCQERFQKHIRFRTAPIGIKYLASKEDIPDGTYLPSDDPAHPIEPTICQLAHIARHTELLVGGYRPFLGCPPGMRLSGMVDVKMSSANEGGAPPGANVYLKNDPEVFQNAASRFRALPRGVNAALIAAPLNIMPLMPDLIIQYGTPAQIDRLVKAYAYGTGKSPSYRGGGGVAEFCYSGIIVPMLDGDVAIVNDWEGRAFGYAQDDELCLSIPISRIDAILEGLEAQKEMLAMRCPPVPSTIPGFDLRARIAGQLDVDSPIGSVATTLGMSKHWVGMTEKIKEKYGDERLQVDRFGRKASS